MDVRDNCEITGVNILFIFYIVILRQNGIGNSSVEDPLLDMIVAVVVEWLACLPVTQKIGVHFYLESNAAPRAAALT